MVNRDYQPRAETPDSPFLPVFPLPASSVSHAQLQRTRGNAFQLNHTPQPVTPLKAMSPSPSVSSVSTNTTFTHQPATPANIHPPPAYVAEFGASQVVSERKRRRSDGEGGSRGGDGGAASAFARPGRDDMQFSTAALALVNGFLDHTLYSILLLAKSTTLTALRPAVTEVLKYQLAREAIASAEEELVELLAGGEEEEEEMNSRQSHAERNRKWDTELVWKRTRLRVMVYIRLGEMEDDDEERFVREDDAFHGSDRRFSHSTGLVSWAAAIFLTSVLEYVAEQVLQVAGQAADSRARREALNSGVTAPAARRGVTVEASDMEKVALNPTLGRLWRTWRKYSRNHNANHNIDASGHSTPTNSGSVGNSSRRLSRDHSNGRAMSFGMGSDSASASAVDESWPPSTARAEDRDVSEDGREQELPEAQYPEHVLAANIPLPMPDRKRDVDEIEVPGLSRDPDEADTDSNQTPAETTPRRRNSWSGILSAPVADDVSDGLATSGSATSMQRTADPSEELRPTIPARFATRQPRPASVPIPRWRPVPESKVEVLDAGALHTDAVAEAAAAAKPEQKANAAEMALHKRKVSVGPTPSIDRATNDTRPAENFENKSKSPLEGDVGNDGASQTSSATSAARTIHYDSGSGQQDGEAMEERVGHAAPAFSEVEEVEERDNQKSPAQDMKWLKAPGGEKRKSLNKSNDEARPAKRLSLTQAVLVRAASQRASHESIASRDGRAGNVTAESEGQSDELKKRRTECIGVARTSNEAVSRSKDEESQDTSRHAGDSFTSTAPRQTSRIVLRDSIDNPPSPGRREIQAMQQTEQRSVPLSPEQFLKGRSLAAKPAQLERTKSQQQQSRTPVEQTRFPEVAPLPPGAPLADVYSNNPDTPRKYQSPSPWHQPSSAAGNGNDLWIPASNRSAFTWDSSHPVQTHQSTQQAASPKPESRPKEPDTSNPLTSASIKGPEDFEMFVQGGDTVKFTLTPESVRGGSSTFSDTVPYLKRSVEKGPKPLSPRSPHMLDTRNGRSQTSKPVTSAGDDGETASSRSAKDRRRSTSRPPVRNVSAHRRSGLMAREATVMTETTRDFADFIRSTGPNKEPDLQPLTSRSTASLQSLNGSRSQSPGGTSVRSMSRARTQGKNAPPVPALPRNNQQPRAASTTSDDSSALIDFIRTGPRSFGPGEAGAKQNHRIPRTVAPFRSTMDSDQLQEWGLDRVNAQPELKLNTNIQSESSVRSASSVKSSHDSYRIPANSRSALVNHTLSSVVHPAHSEQPTRLTSSAPPRTVPSVFPNTSVPRTRVRNKDPYHVDLSDDDDDDELLTALPKTQRLEESLADFLRNSEPPVDNNPPSLPPSAAKSLAVPARKASMGGPRTTFQARDRGGGGNTSSVADTSDLANFLRSSGPSLANATASRGDDSLADRKGSIAASGISRRTSRSFFGGMRFFGRRKHAA